MDDIITDISYTSKDFQSIYPELLDLVKKLTNKWDPSLSNESDPGVILLKLNALIADKNNYNIDKNFSNIIYIIKTTIHILLRNNSYFKFTSYSFKKLYIYSVDAKCFNCNV